MLLKTNEAAARSSRGRIRTKRQGQQQQNRPKRESRRRLFL
jgi:hypothetical protein